MGGGRLKKKSPNGASCEILKQCGLKWFFGAGWFGSLPAAFEDEVGVLPNEGFTVCKSDDAVKQAVLVFHKAKPAFEEFKGFDAGGFVCVIGAELD